MNIWIHWIDHRDNWTVAHHPDKVRSRNEFSPRFLCGRWLPDGRHWEIVEHPEKVKKCSVCEKIINK